MKFITQYAKYVVYGGIFLLPFIIFIVDASQVFPFITGKNFMFRAVTEFMLGAWIVLMFLDATYRPKKSWIVGAVTLFVGIMLIANLSGMYPYKSIWSNFERMEGWVTLAHLLVYLFVVGTCLNTEKLWMRFWHTMTGASVAMGLFALVQLFRAYGVKTLGWAADQGLMKLLPIINQGGDRVDGTLGNATYLAEFMMFSAFVTMFLYIRNKRANIYMKVFYGVAFFLQVFVLYETATRGAILGFIGGIFLIGILLGLLEKEKGKVRNVATGIVLGVLVFVGLFFSVRNTSFVQHSQTMSRFANISLEDGTTKSRFLLWGVAIEGFKESPVLGYGQENFNYVFNKHYNPKLYAQEQWFDRAHNFVFDWLIAGGVLGLLSYLLILGMAFRAIWKARNFSLHEKVIFTGLLSAYIFQNLFVFDQIVGYLTLFSFLSYLHFSTTDEPLMPKLFDVDEGVRERVVVPIILVLTFVVVYLVNSSGYFQSRTAIKAMQVAPSSTVEELQINLRESRERYNKALAYNSFGTTEIRERLPQMLLQIVSSEQIEDDIKQKFLLLTEQELLAQVDETPLDARYHLILGSFYSSFNSHDQAVIEFEKARELSPLKQSILLSLAQAHLRASNFDKALENAKYAYDLEINNDEAWRVYTLINAFAGKGDEYNALVGAALEAKQYDRVSNMLRMYIQSNPADVQLRINLAAVMLEQGNKVGAIEVINQARKDILEFDEQGAEIVKKIEASGV